MNQAARVIIIGNSDIENVSRLQMIAASLSNSGFEAVCVAGSSSPEPSTILSDEQLRTFLLKTDLKCRIQDFILRVLAVLLSIISRNLWKKLYLLQTTLRGLDQQLHGLGLRREDIIFASHWSTLPLAMKWAGHIGSRIVYDENEASLSEHADRSWIGRIYTCLASCTHRDQTVKLAAVVAPSPYYRNAFIDNQKTRNIVSKDASVRGAVIRNLQPLANVTAPPENLRGKNITISYQGLAITNRNLELIVRSAADWPPNTVLDLQLLGVGEFVDHIREFAEMVLSADRLQLLEPVPGTDIATSLAEREVDVGLCVFDPSLHQLKGSLPNKFFAYLAAGGSVIAVRGTDCASLLEHYDMGYVIDGLTASDLTNCVDQIVNDPATLHARRKNAHHFVLQNNWESESELLLTVIDDIIQERPA